MATYWENSCSFGLRYVSWYKCLIVSLVFSHLGFWSGNLFLIAPSPDICLLVPSNKLRNVYTIRSTTRNITIQKRKIYYIKIKVIALIINFRRNKSISTERCRSKKGASVSEILALFNCSSRCMALWPPDYNLAVHLALCILLVLSKLAL